MGKFSVMDYMNGESMKMAQKELSKPGELTKVSVFDIEPNENNFYGIRGIKMLKESILMLGGVQENLILVKNPSGSRYKYKALAGHRRRIACMELVQEGYKEYEYVPADIKSNLTPAIEKGILLLTNSTQRGELTDYEKVMEHIETRKLIEEYKKETGERGRIREMEAEYLNVSQGQIAIYDKIINNLGNELMQYFEQGKFGITAAYEIAKRDPADQEMIIDYLGEHDQINESDIKRICGSRIKGQASVEDIPELQPEKNVTDSVTLEEPTENETMAADQSPDVLAPTEDNIEMAVEFIFDDCKDNTFPKQEFDKLVECFKNGCGSFNAYLDQTNIFDNMLPFENDCVTVYLDCEYYVRFIHTNETVRIIKYQFWEMFEKKYSWMWKDEKVTETVTSKVPEKEEIAEKEQITEESPDCEVEQLTEDSEDIEHDELAAEYTLDDVQKYIKQYKKNCELCAQFKEEMKGTEPYKKTAIILDALKLLEDKMRGEQDESDS